GGAGVLAAAEMGAPYFGMNGDQIPVQGNWYADGLLWFAGPSGWPGITPIEGKSNAQRIQIEDAHSGYDRIGYCCLHGFPGIWR
ncbi:MAG: hypothetical protein AAGF89_14570, partial [Bacteroidota bacterium]